MMVTELGEARQEDARIDDVQVIPLLRRQASLYSMLEGFAQRQRGLVENEDTTPLLALLAQRQKLAMELAVVSRQLAPIRSRWNAVREKLGIGEQHEADELIDQARCRLLSVIQSDEEDARRLMLRKQVVKHSLHASQKKGTAAKAYHSATSSFGRKVDQES